MKQILLPLLLALTGPALADSIAWSPDGTTVAVGRAGKRISLLDPTSGRVIASLRGTGPKVTHRSLGPDSSYEVDDAVTHLGFGGAYLFSNGEDSTLRVWQPPPLKPVAQRPGPYVPTGLAVSADGTQVAYSDSSSRDLTADVHLWRWANSKFVGIILPDVPPPEGAFGQPAFSPDGRWLTCGGSYGKRLLWKLGGSTPEFIEVPRMTCSESPSTALSDTHLASGCAGQVWLSELSNVSATPLTAKVPDARILCFVPGALVAAGSGNITFLDRTSLKSVRHLKVEFESLAFAPDGTRFAIRRKDRWAVLQAQDGKVLISGKLPS